MYKWHAQSAIGRSRPSNGDFLRVADGIAASLRQFSCSVTRAVEESNTPRFTIRRLNSVGEGLPSRTKRSQNAVNELESIQPSKAVNAHTRGIDATSLAAKSPEGLRISRMAVDNDQATSDPESRNTTFNPNFTRSRAQIQSHRTDFQGSRGRGGTRGRGRGRGARNPRQRTKQGGADAQPDPFMEPKKLPDYTWEEKQWQRHMDGNYADGPYEPQTNLEQLLYKGPAVLSSPQGLLSNIMHKLRTGTGTLPGYQHAKDHLTELRTSGVAAFGDNIDAEAGKEFLAKRVELKQLDEKERALLSNTWAAGHYEEPKSAAANDILALVQNFTRRNETYLPEHSRTLQKKLETFVPSLAAATPVDSKSKSGAVKRK